MKKVSLLLVGLLCLSVMVHAGEVITNDAGEEATGLRVTFSSPVLITAFGDILTAVDQTALSYEFIFSGGTVKPWETHWFNYAPATASVMETEWLEAASLTDDSSETASQISGEHTIENLQFVNIGFYWNWFLDGLSEDYIAQKFREVEAAGYGGVSFDYWIFISTISSTDVFKLHEETPRYGLETPTDSELERLLRIVVENTDLKIEMRIQINCNEYDFGPNIRLGLQPSSPTRLFDDLFDEIKPVIELCNEYGVSIFTPLVELDSLEKYTTEIHRLLDRLDPLFDGWFSINQSTNNWIRAGIWSPNKAGDFWDWIDSDGRPLIIGFSCNEPPLATTSTASKESMKAEFISFWGAPLRYYREAFPGHQVWFGELAASRNEGTSMGYDETKARDTAPLALDEMQRVFWAMLEGAKVLGMDGYVIQYYTFYPPRFREDNTFHLLIPDSAKPFIEDLLL